MFKAIKTSKVSRVISTYLALQLVISTVQPTKMFALTGGPSQPEFNSFTPIGTSDMVNLSSGDFNYNIPIMDVGGYPLNLAYDSGISMDQEASWVGLGWNLNVGQINRQVRGIPDDFKGDEMVYTNEMKPNKTIGLTMSVNPQAVGAENFPVNLSYSATLQHNNYQGFSFSPSFGVSLKFGENTSVGMNLSQSVDNGFSASPSLSFSQTSYETEGSTVNGITTGLGVGATLNSRQGLSSFNINASSSNSSYEINDAGSKVDGSETKGGTNSSSASISFINNTFTPSKRTAYENFNATFRGTLGLNIAAINAEFGVSAFVSSQKLKRRKVSTKAFGYENTESASREDILDFNRENERIIDKSTLTLPTVNYTYDIYNIQGQGIGGQFRPFKSQVGLLFNQQIEDSGDSFSLGAEVQVGYGGHWGVDVHYSPTISRTGIWDAPVTNMFKPSSNNSLKYEPTYFKTIGDLSVDDNVELYSNTLSGESPMALKLSQGGYNKKPLARFNAKTYNAQDLPSYSLKPFNNRIQRTKREKRNQAILKVTNGDARVDKFVKGNQYLKPHHTNGVRVLNPDGSTYVYGEAAVNKTKEEVTFGTNNPPNLNEGTVASEQDVTRSSGGFDEFYSKIETPDYAHTYLLTSVLSTDYEDVTQNGPTDDDLGSYTLFNYSQMDRDYKWRVPLSGASYNAGLYTKTNDQKGSYISGTKELKYLNTIETKTHVAVFDLSERYDGQGVDDSKMYKINTIKLYTKPEYKLLTEGDNQVTPIKTAHFVYDYSLCQDLDNNDGTQPDGNDEYVIANQDGKLTLKSIYFTYRGSNMGKYTPYKFNYENINPDYQVKSYDIWGNYKPLFEEDADFENSTCESKYPITAQEFPFVKQDNKTDVDSYVSAWTLSSIDLPSGGRLDVEYESDDYAFVQNRDAMRMFKVKGFENIGERELYGDLFSGEDDRPSVIIKLDRPVSTVEEFKQFYLGEHINKPIFFRYLMNMTRTGDCEYDYVEGYFNIDNASNREFVILDDDHMKIPIEALDLEGGISGNNKINPFSKAGFFFARQHLNRYAYGTGDNSPSSTSVNDILNAIGSNIAMTAEIFRGPNGYLKDRGIAQKVVLEKSWIRLKHPSSSKFGGGIRVKSLSMDDNWDVMLNEGETIGTQSVYSNFYGQEYSYAAANSSSSNSNDPNYKSSGVATWEPNMSKENPYIEPFFDDKERLSAHTYIEKPFGKSFFPGARVTYSRVEVNNISREDADAGIVKKHATGKVIHEFYTSKDFPTKADFTEIDDKDNYISNQANVLDNLLNLNIKTELTLSQGFSVITNDMNGKQKSQWVYDETGNKLSGVEYKYNISEETGELDNLLPVILKDGTSSKQLIGTHYDVITDFNESYNLSETYGANVNLTYFQVGPFPFFLGMLPFEYKRNESTLHTTTTTKVVNKSGILKEKIAYDLGSKVSTRNIAWDAVSGQVLLTETDNEYNDNYYNLNYPAHWAYPQMGQAVDNLGLEIKIKPFGLNTTITGQSGDEEGDSAFYVFDDASFAGNRTFSSYLNIGDEVLIYNSDNPIASKRLWVNELKIQPIFFSTVTFIDERGRIYNACGDNDRPKTIKVVRSMYRNLQNTSMASITTMKNPLLDNIISENEFNVEDDTTFNNNPRIINASAVEYKDYWRNPADGNTIAYPNGENIEGFNNNTKTTEYPYFHPVNPYVHNIKGDWRAVKSYAYLTGRNNNTAESETSARHTGYFKTFKPYYVFRFGSIISPADNRENWTFASEVTQYSKYGAEVENKDALDRYSAAQYGYGYTMPVAVASNSRYSEMGYDGFEDYNNGQVLNKHFRTSLPIDEDQQGPQPNPNDGDLPPRGVPNENQNDIITNEESHTGQFSLRVDGNSTYKSGDINLEETFSLNRLDCSDPLPPEECTISMNLPDAQITGNNTHTYTYSQVFGTTDVISGIPSFASNCIMNVVFDDNEGTLRITVQSNCDSTCGQIINVNLNVDGEICDYFLEFSFNRGGNGPGQNNC